MIDFPNNFLPGDLARSAAIDSGFDLVGLTEAVWLERDHARYASWLEAGFHGEMTYLARDPDRRANPRRSLPDAASVVMVGLNYYQDSTYEERPGAGRVARYARGRDYHKVIDRRLRSLAEQLAAVSRSAGRPEPEQRWFVDYGPLLERSFAVRAGLGYIGKNGMLINGRIGSYFFLAALLTTERFSLEDQPREDHGRCGNCRRCLDACPTGAIVREGVVDARRCISYLTIERPTEISTELGERMGDLIFGCDVCQEVCPHNHKAIPTTVPDFLSDRGVGEYLNINEVLRWDSREAYLARVAGTPLTRSRRENLQRNARMVRDNIAAGRRHPTPRYRFP